MSDEELKRIEEAKFFMNYIQKEGHSIVYDEKKDATACDNIRAFTKVFLYTNAKLPLENLTFLPKDQVLEISLQILKEIFGDSISQKDYLKFTKRIITTGGNNPFEGSVSLIGKNKYMLFETIGKVESIPTVVHEGTHCFIPKKCTPNFHQIEIMPILTELIAAHIVEDRELSDNLIDRILELRIYGLHRRFQNHIDSRKKSNDFILEKTLPTLNTEYLKIYDEQILYTYTISFIYAINLYLKYLEDSKTMSKKINAVVKSRKPINYLIDYYGISLTQSSTFDEPNRIAKIYR